MNDGMKIKPSTITPVIPNIIFNIDNILLYLNNINPVIIKYIPNNTPRISQNTCSNVDLLMSMYFVNKILF